MKIKLLIISVICLSSLAFTQYGEAGLIVMSIEEMAERSDAIVIGTIQSTWIDFRPFDDRHVVVDTAKIKVDDWLKNDKNTTTLEIRYYGYWAKLIDDLRSRFIFDNPLYSYESGQKVLLILDHEEPTGVMGAGYYPFFEGSFVINDDIAISQTGVQTELKSLKKTIYDNLENKSGAIPIKVSISESQFKEIKSNIEKTQYDICDIRLENNIIVIDLHKFFKDSEPEKTIISHVPKSFEHVIVYHEGYSDYFINTITHHKCEELNEN